eukprot:scaffold3852_cov106-Skeletonema_marinoi.AAC.3
MEELERNLFTDECRRFLATETNVADVGVSGGEEDVRRDQHGNVSRGGRPNLTETTLTRLGKEIRDKLCTKFQNANRERPTQNWFRQNNRFLD